jgi:hypothetical protein
MQTATTTTRWIVRLAGLTQIILGVTFWTGHALSLIPVHMIVGMVVVLGLWTLAGLAGRVSAPRGLVVLAVALGIVVPVFGIVHAGILPGSFHWVIRIVHLLLGLGALRLAELLAEYVTRRAATPTAREPVAQMHGG